MRLLSAPFRQPEAATCPVGVGLRWKGLVRYPAPTNSEAFATCQLHSDSSGTYFAIDNPRDIVKIAARVLGNLEIIFIRKLTVFEIVSNVKMANKAS